MYNYYTATIQAGWRTVSLSYKAFQLSLNVHITIKACVVKYESIVCMISYKPLFVYSP